MPKPLTKKDIILALREYGVATQKELASGFSSSEKKIDKKLLKLKKDLQNNIANIAVNSPTDKEFFNVEKRVKRLEGYHHYS